MPGHLSPPSERRRIPSRASCALTIVAAAALAAAHPAAAQQPARANKANWALAERFEPEALRPVLYSAAVAPHWIGKSDSMWYNWKNHAGSAFYLVVPALKLRRPLFDQVKLAAALTAA